MKEYALWALPKGQTDRLYEQVMGVGSRERLDKIKPYAAADGWHGFRVVLIEAPDFTKGLS